MIDLGSSIAVVNANATQRNRLVSGLGIHTVGDLLRHFPRRYLDLREATDLGERPPQKGEMLIAVGTIVSAQSFDSRPGRKRTYRRVAEVEVAGGTTIPVTLFARSQHISDWHDRQYVVGRRLLMIGKVDTFRGQVQLTNPDVEFLDGEGRDGTRPGREQLPYWAIYPLTDKITNRQMQDAIDFALGAVEEYPDLIPEQIRASRGLPDLATALRWIHTPRAPREYREARQRFRFEEALVAQTVLARRRLAAAELAAVARDGGDLALSTAFTERLPFELTPAQRTVADEIAADLARPMPMNRLLQGEVGSGKTVVALLAMLRVVDSGGQAALLAPTEVLAQQHHRSLLDLLGDLAGQGLLAADVSTRVELLTGSMTKKQRTEPLLGLASGEAGIVVGTHALLQEQVQFADLGLVVVDEQHRFGVEQRAALTEKGVAAPHVLVMTATPIPRTVAMTVFGDLEISTIAELPRGRQPIQTTLVDLHRNPAWEERIWERVAEEVASGRQVYVVCPRVAPDEDPDGGRHSSPRAEPENSVLGQIAAAESVFGDLRDRVLPRLRIGLLHGQLPAEVKDTTMKAFSNGDLDVLVATTVIEVGVDVPNASTMVILDAERFGVSQLHQLRGRVGRGSHPGLCLLVTTFPGETDQRFDRLKAVAETEDGFELSRIDLELRREGDVLGASQSGRRSGLENLRVLRDEKTIVDARAAADEILAADRELESHPLLRAAVTELASSDEAAFMDKS